MNVPQFFPQGDQRNDALKHGAEFLAMLEDLIQALDQVAIAEGDSWLYHGHTISKKFFFHVHAAYALLPGVTIPGVGLDVLPFGSIFAIVRAAIETFVTFGHVYGAEDPDERYFRFLIWTAAGLNDRQSFNATTREAQEVIAAEALEIQRLLAEIQAHPRFQGLDKEARGRITGKRIEWRGAKSWAQLASESGIHSGYFQQLYGFLCSYSHASYMAVLQIGQAPPEKEREMAVSILMALNVFMCQFAVIYARLFPQAEKVLEPYRRTKAFNSWFRDKSFWDSWYGPEKP